VLARILYRKNQGAKPDDIQSGLLWHYLQLLGGHMPPAVRLAGLLREDYALLSGGHAGLYLVKGRSG
jgi:hypothetical protein